MARITSKRLSFAYDKDADVLYVSVGPAKHAVGDLLENGVIVRRDPKTNQVLGFTIVDFMHHFASRKAPPIITPIAAHLQPA